VVFFLSSEQVKDLKTSHIPPSAISHPLFPNPSPFLHFFPYFFNSLPLTSLPQSISLPSTNPLLSHSLPAVFPLSMLLHIQTYEEEKHEFLERERRYKVEITSERIREREVTVGKRIGMDGTR